MSFFASFSSFNTACCTVMPMRRKLQTAPQAPQMFPRRCVISHLPMMSKIACNNTLSIPLTKAIYPVSFKTVASIFFITKTPFRLIFNSFLKGNLSMCSILFWEKISKKFKNFYPNVKKASEISISDAFYQS